jgi:hypothetical protein
VSSSPVLTRRGADLEQRQGEEGRRPWRDGEEGRWWWR